MSPSTQEQAELLQWRSGTRRFVAEVIDLEAGVIETGAIVTAPPPPASSKRPLEVAEAGTSSSLSQVVQAKREKVEMQTKLSEKKKECERLEDDRDILNDTVEPMTTTINALQTKIDALYCIAFATVPEEHRGSLHALSGLGIDVKKRDGAARRSSTTRVGYLPACLPRTRARLQPPLVSSGRAISGIRSYCKRSGRRWAALALGATDEFATRGRDQERGECVRVYF